MKNWMEAVALFACVSASQAAVVITNFGATASSGGSWTYTPGTSTISGTEGPGDLIFGVPNNLNIAGNIYIQLTGTVITAPAGSFTVTLEDTSFNQAIATFQWSSFTGGGPVTVVKPLVFTTFDFTSLGQWSLDSGGSFQPVNASFSTMSATTAVPEPSTYAMLALGGVLLGGVALRRKKASVRA
jgi:hypothetical protein